VSKRSRSVFIENDSETKNGRGKSACCLSKASLQRNNASSSLSVAAKNLPVHCVVETIHNIVESHAVSNSREKWRSPQVETDSYVIIPVAMPFQVRIAFLPRNSLIYLKLLLTKIYVFLILKIITKYFIIYTVFRKDFYML